MGYDQIHHVLPQRRKENVVICSVCNTDKLDVEFPKNRWGITKVCHDCRKARREANRFDSEQKYKAAGFNVVTKSYYSCPHCGKIVGECGE